MTAIKVRNKFTKYPKEVIELEGTEDLCQQHFQQEVDINSIIAKYNQTGVISHVSKAREQYGEFRDLADQLPDLAKVTAAQQAFEQLPSTIRTHVGNSLQGFLEFVNDKKNDELLAKWGIIDAPPPSSKDPTAAPAGGSTIKEPTPGSKKNGSPKNTPIIQESNDD